MKQNVFEQFIGLVEHDRSVHVLEQEIKKNKAAYDLLLGEQDSTKNHLEMYEQKVRTAKKEVDAQERVAQELDQLEKNAREKISCAVNQKEYQSLQKEAEALRAKQHNEEQRLVTVWNLCESIQKERDNFVKSIEKKEKEYKEKIDEQKTKIEQLQKELSEIIGKRHNLEIGLPEEWLTEYVRMRGSMNNPVVLVSDEICSACFFYVSKQDQLSLRARKLVPCKGCHRFLYTEAMKSA